MNKTNFKLFVCFVLGSCLAGCTIATPPECVDGLIHYNISEKEYELCVGEKYTQTYKLESEQQSGCTLNDKDYDVGSSVCLTDIPLRMKCIVNKLDPSNKLWMPEFLSEPCQNENDTDSPQISTCESSEKKCIVAGESLTYVYDCRENKLNISYCLHGCDESGVCLLEEKPECNNGDIDDNVGSNLRLCAGEKFAQTYNYKKEQIGCVINGKQYNEGDMACLEDQPLKLKCMKNQEDDTNYWLPMVLDEPCHSQDQEVKINCPNKESHCIIADSITSFEYTCSPSGLTISYCNEGSCDQDKCRKHPKCGKNYYDCLYSTGVDKVRCKEDSVYECENEDCCYAETCISGYYRVDELAICKHNDNDNCNGPGIKCGKNEECKDNVCKCKEGFVKCGDSCVDLNTDALHCGQCNHKCNDVNGTASCVNKTCELSCNENFELNPGGDSCIRKGSCDAGASICEDLTTNENGVIAQVTNCTDAGIWAEESTPCNSGISCNGKQCGECANGTVVCTNDPNTGIGELRTCVNGVSQTSTCEKSCNAEGNDCGNCINGTKLCANLSYLVCQDGSFVQQKECNAPLDNGYYRCDITTLNSTNTDDPCVPECNTGYYYNEGFCAPELHCDETGYYPQECVITDANATVNIEAGTYCCSQATYCKDLKKGSTSDTTLKNCINVKKLSDAEKLCTESTHPLTCVHNNTSTNSTVYCCKNSTYCKKAIDGQTPPSTYCQKQVEVIPPVEVEGPCTDVDYPSYCESSSGSSPGTIQYCCESDLVCQKVENGTMPVSIITKQCKLAAEEEADPELCTDSAKPIYCEYNRRAYCCDTTSNCQKLNDGVTVSPNKCQSLKESPVSEDSCPNYTCRVFNSLNQTIACCDSASECTKFRNGDLTANCLALAD